MVRRSSAGVVSQSKFMEYFLFILAHSAGSGFRLALRVYEKSGAGPYALVSVPTYGLWLFIKRKMKNPPK